MNELVLALIFIYLPTVVLLFYLGRFLINRKSDVILVNKKIAPFLFPLYLLLSIAFRLEIVGNFLEWLGMSKEIVSALLIFAVIDNILLFFLQEQRIGNIIKAYVKYLRHDTPEFALVLLLSLLCGLVTFFKTRVIYDSPLLLTTGVFLGVLLLLPLVLYHYSDLRLEFKFEIKPELLVNLIKMFFFIFCPLLFVRLFKLLIFTGSIKDVEVLVLFWVFESLILLMLWKKIIKIPAAITESLIYKNGKDKTTAIIKKVMFFVYNHIEVAAVLLLLLIISWPLALARIDDYRNWRSNFPVIKKATPVMGMQGSMLILTGEHFGTTGLGVPGKVMVGQVELMTPEWGDKKIVAIVPVPPPNGDLYVKKQFKWKKGVEYVSQSNHMSFENFDWSSANNEETEKFIELLQTEYRQK